MKKIISIVLIFLVIFSPSLPLFYSGAFLAGGISLILLLFNKRKINFFTKQLKSHYILGVLGFLLFISCSVVFIAAFYATYDFSMVKTLINQMLNVVSVLLVVSYVYDNAISIEKLKLLLFYAFVIQTISILVSFTVPAYHNFVLSIGNFSEHMLNYYGGLRTHSIAGSNFFGLGATYGLIYILYLDSMVRYHWYSIKYILILILLVVGTIFIARTGFVGLAFGLLMVGFKSLNKITLWIRFFKIIFVISLVGFVLYSFLPIEIQDDLSSRVFKYAFELFLHRDGGYSTTSTDNLNRMWHINIKEITWLFGDGLYTTEQGYYMKTDAGYLRQILFGGVGFFLLFLFYQLYFLKKMYLKGFYLLYITILIYTLVLHIKGEVLGFLIIYQSVLLFFILINSFKQEINK